MIKCFRTLLATLVVALVLATGFSASPVLAAGNGTTVGSLSLTATIECIGVYANFSNDDNGNNQAILEYRTAGGTWKQGMALTVDRRATFINGYGDNPWKNQWRGSILGLTPNTQYEVRVTFTDTDGVTGTNPITATVTTNKDSFPLGSGTSYYVATTGDDEDAGTIGAPWATIQHAVDTVVAGDIIYLRAGTFHEHNIHITTSGLANNYITMMPYPSENVIIDADNIAGFGNLYGCIVLDEAQYWHIVGLKDIDDYTYIRGLFHWLAYTNPQAIREIYESEEYSDMIGLTIQNVGSDGWTGMAGVRMTRGSIHNVIECIEIKDFGYVVPDAGILFEATSSYNLIQYNIIHSERNTYGDYHHRATGVCFTYLDHYFGYPYDDYPGLGNVVRYNHIYSDNVGLGDGIGGNRNTQVNDGPYQDCDIYGNYLHGLGDEGVECEGGDVNIRIWGNLTDDTYNGVAFAPVIVGPVYIIRNQSSNWEDAAFKLGKYADEVGDGYLYIYHNSLYTPDPNSWTRPFGMYPEGGDSWFNTIVRNNILFTSGAGIRVHYPSTQVGYGNSYDFDCIYQEGQSSNYLTYWIDTVYTSIAAFNAVSGQEAHGQGGYETGNPLFVNPSLGNFHLQAGSPCRNAGVVILGFNDAESPWPYSGSAPDIGAYEYDSGAPPVNDADINSDGLVNILDTIRIVQHWGEIGAPGWIQEDINEDGTVNILDIILVGQNWTG